MRDPERPIGRIPRSGRGAGRRASAIHFFIIYEGMQHVFMDDDGNVFAVSCGMTCAERMLKAHPDWLVGTYHDTKSRRGSFRGESIRELITADLLLRAAELWPCAA